MGNIWAPWRMEYILNKKEEGCIFCTKPRESDDRGNYILYRGERIFVIMNKFPYNNGHLMVAPYKHTSDLHGLASDELLELMQLTQRGIGVISQAFRPEGFNIGINLGKVAGAGIEDHVHLHIVPRWSGDTNFMPVIGETKIIPQYLSDAYDQLYPLFQTRES